MNYLAHIYLSGDREMIRIGNYIADHVKGSKYRNFPTEIQKGILLHRKIDWFTDQDEIVRQSKRRLNDRHGHYKGVIIDILYDHMLASQWSKYSEIRLDDYAREFYSSLEEHRHLIPDKMQMFTDYMIRYDWLTSYSEAEGIASVLEGMNRRTGGKGKMDLAVEDLQEHFQELYSDFERFFEKLRIFSAQNLRDFDAQFSS